MITKLEMCPSCVQQMKLHSLSQFNIRLYDLFLFFPPAQDLSNSRSSWLTNRWKNQIITNQNLQNERNIHFEVTFTNITVRADSVLKQQYSIPCKG